MKILLILCFFNDFTADRGILVKVLSYEEDTKAGKENLQRTKEG